MATPGTWAWLQLIIAEVGFYEYQDGGYGVSSVRILDLRCGITEIKAARSAQQTIDQAAGDTLGN